MCNSSHFLSRFDSLTLVRPKSITAASCQVRDNLARAKVRYVCCVASFHKFHYNDLLPTSWQLPRLRGSYVETCVMDFGHDCAYIYKYFRFGSAIISGCPSSLKSPTWSLLSSLWFNKKKDKLSFFLNQTSGFLTPSATRYRGFSYNMQISCFRRAKKM